MSTPQRHESYSTKHEVKRQDARGGDSDGTKMSARRVSKRGVETVESCDDDWALWYKDGGRERSGESENRKHRQVGRSTPRSRGRRQAYPWLVSFWFESSSKASAIRKKSFERKGKR